MDSHYLSQRNSPVYSFSTRLIASSLEDETMPRDLTTIIRSAIPEWRRGNEKQGKSIVQSAIADALVAAGYDVDKEDTRCFLKTGMPVWQRYITDGVEVEPTGNRRRIDVVVYAGDSRTPLAILEVESDLAHMGRNTNRLSKGSYAVASIARNADGQPFDSYRSVERMAAAAQYWAMEGASGGRYPNCDEGVARLRGIRSNSPAEHNPTGLGLFLVSHFAKAEHVESLRQRLDSLRMQLIVGTGG